MSYPTYFLAPNLDFRPNGTIRLGNIIADPLRPRQVLSSLTDEELAARYPRIEKAYLTSRKTVQSQGRDLSVDVWTHFLNLNSASISGSRNEDASNEYSMESILTEYFLQEPEPVEIAMRAAESRVKQILTGSFFSRRQPVFMIIGLKTAKGFDFRRHVRRETSATAGAESSVAPEGEVSLGANIGGTTNNDLLDQWFTPEDVVFGFELLKISLRGFGSNKKPETDIHVPRSAFLGLHNDGEIGDNEVSDDPVEVETSAAASEDIDEEESKDVVALSDGDLKALAVSLAPR